MIAIHVMIEIGNDNLSGNNILMSKRLEKAEAFKSEVEGKIQNLIVEFAAGKISREQFHLLYNRYNGQLSVANEAIAENDMRALKEIQNSVPTIFVKEATAGKAIGMSIFHHDSREFIESLGEFNVPIGQLTPVLHHMISRIDANEFVEPKVVNLKRGQWLIFESRQLTTIVTVFQNEPSAVQIRELQRLHHDFEIANRRFLEMDTVNATLLGYPFLSIVQRSLGK